MGRELRRQAPALIVACLALVAALGGTVYAAARINGKSIRVKSLPGNRLVPASIPASRLKPGVIPASGAGLSATETIPGAQIDTATLGQVPSALHADTADSARDAETALNAVNAIDAVKVNGYEAGCRPPARLFAGACWQGGSSEATVSATAAARSCANQGGELPSALALAAFAEQPGIALAAGGEWTGDVASFSGPDVYAVITVSESVQINTAASTAEKKYRCVIPLVA